MKLKTIGLLGLLGVTAAGTLGACSENAPYAGQWQGTPENIVSIPGASDATATLTLDFAPSEQKGGTGTVNISAVVEVEQAVTGAMPGIDEPYEVSVAATASITGRYTRDGDDDDDLIVTFDPETMNVNVDPSGVTFSTNVLTGAQQPVLDSLSTATARNWKTALTPALREIFNRYRTIEDIKVHHGDMMSCEIDHRDCTFRRVGVPD